MSYQKSYEMVEEQSGVLPRQQLIVVSSYTRFDNLAHGPRGTEAKHAFYTFRMDTTNGELVLVTQAEDSVMNPAFSRFNPKTNTLYTCTESVAEDGQILSWSVCPRTGSLTKVGECSAGGSSTCYLLLDKQAKNMLVVNYWDATIGVFAIDDSSRAVTQQLSMYDPNEGRQMRARADRHVNHSINDSSAQQERQADPHSHAIVLDPVFGRIAYVPDLGMDLIRQFRYDDVRGTLTPLGAIPSGPPGRKALGPRYLDFHPTLPVCYVINELSSEVSVFEFDRSAAELLGADPTAEAVPTLNLVQTVRTIPEAFPSRLNTCGRISVHSGGNFVLVSNRGHNSVTVLRVHHEMHQQGLLSVVGITHTRGATPRHFQFDSSGQWLISANQDSDSIGVFRFNIATGKLEWTGNQYSVPSPNFVCSVMPQTLPKAFKPQAVAEEAVARAVGRDLGVALPVVAAVSSKL